MRFNVDLSGPGWGEVRTVERFLLFPVRIDQEIRWLERARIEQCWYPLPGWDCATWNNVRFVDGDQDVATDHQTKRLGIEMARGIEDFRRNNPKGPTR